MGAGIAVDPDLPASHAYFRPYEHSAGVMSHVATNVDPPTAHLSAKPVARIARHGEQSASHRLACVPAEAPLDANLAPLHPRANPVHGGEIAFELPRHVTCVAGYAKQFGKRQFPVALPDECFPYLRQRLLGERSRCYASQ